MNSSPPTIASTPVTLPMTWTNTAVPATDGWNLTGDAFIEDADGYFHFSARTDDIIVSGGYKIAAPEIEAALLTHPQVLECAVIGIEDGTRGQIVQAHVVLCEGVCPDEAMARVLQDHVKAVIAPYKYPRSVVFRAGLPRTPTGKIQRFRLKDEGQVTRGGGSQPDSG